MTITVGELVSFGPQDLGNEGRWSTGTHIFCTRLCVSSKGIFAAALGGPPPREEIPTWGEERPPTPGTKESRGACAGARSGARCAALGNVLCAKSWTLACRGIGGLCEGRRTVAASTAGLSALESPGMLGRSDSRDPAAQHARSPALQLYQDATRSARPFKVSGPAAQLTSALGGPHSLRPSPLSRGKRISEPGGVFLAPPAGGHQCYLVPGPTTTRSPGLLFTLVRPFSGYPLRRPE